MSEHIRQSIRLTTRHFSLILILSLLSSMTALERTGYLVLKQFSSLVSLLVIVANLIIFVIIFCRIAEAVTEQPPGPIKTLLKEHLCNFLLVGILLALPPLLVAFIASRIYPSPEEWKPFFMISSLAVSILTLYVMPYVFVHRQRLGAIKNGIRFLLTHLRLSTPLIIVTVSVTGIHNLGISQQFERLYLIGGTIFIVNLFSKYITFALFAFAALILHEHGELEQAPAEIQPATQTP